MSRRGVGCAIGIIGLCTLGTPLPAWSAVSARLPQLVDSGMRDPAAPLRNWTVSDLVQIRRITEVAVSDATKQVAFVLKVPVLESGEIVYGLYVFDAHASVARKVVESAYLDQLSWRPGANTWTVRGDFGDGIQLYEIDASGHHTALVTAETVSVGAYESSAERSATEGPRQMGVASYGWAPDGKTLWYARFRLRDPEEQEVFSNQGIRYNDQNMWPHTFFNTSANILGTELHLVNPAEGSDRELAFAPGSYGASTAFDRDLGAVSWDSAAAHLQYRLWSIESTGHSDVSLWSVDVHSGQAQRMTGRSTTEVFQTVPDRDGRSYWTLRYKGPAHHLLKIAVDSGAETDFGAVAFDGLGTGRELWQTPAGQTVFAVRYEDRDGLVAFPSLPSAQKIEAESDSLSHCSFTNDLTYGVCVRESLTLPPQLAEVSLASGSVSTLVRPNTQLDDITPLKSERTQWRNRYGSLNSGYITWPRGYQRGHAYPTIVVTHGHGARNRFADDGFQWEIPIQVLAEQGYLVLSVNEPRETPKSQAADDARIAAQAVSQSDFKLSEAFDPVSSMEAALQAAIAAGAADPQRSGIAGYSRGAEIVEYAMTQSSLFKAAVEGDAGGFTAGGYWGQGSASMRLMYRQLYGGSPLDPKSQKNYLELSPSFRADRFAGPLLQLFSQTNAYAGLELNALLKDHAIPTELVYFPHENHVFWQPNRRAAAMQRCLEWFDYWLRGLKDPGERQEQYEDWDAMAARWHAGASGPHP